MRRWSLAAKAAREQGDASGSFASTSTVVDDSLPVAPTSTVRPASPTGAKRGSLPAIGTSGVFLTTSSMSSSIDEMDALSSGEFFVETDLVGPYRLSPGQVGAPEAQGQPCGHDMKWGQWPPVQGAREGGGMGVQVSWRPTHHPHWGFGVA